jgi:hypothetical protein
LGNVACVNSVWFVLVCSDFCVFGLVWVIRAAPLFTSLQMDKNSVQSRAYYHARKAARDEGLSQEEELSAGAAAHKKAGDEWVPNLD